MKIKSQALQFGNFIEELGLIKNVTIDGNIVRLKALPKYLEGYGIEDTGEVGLDVEFEVSSPRETINYCIVCFNQLTNSKGYVDAATKKLNKWINNYRFSTHRKSYKKMRNLVVGDLIKHGLVVKKDPSPIFKNSSIIPFIGKSYKYFSESTMVHFNDTFKDGEGLDEMVEVYNNNYDYVRQFIDDSREDIIKSIEMLDESILFVKQVYANILNISIDDVDFSEVRYNG